MTNITPLSFKEFQKLPPKQGYDRLLKLTDDVRYLQYQVEQLRHRLFGRRSEKMNDSTPQQMEIKFPDAPVFDEAPTPNEAPDPEEETSVEEAPDQKEPQKTQKKTGRKPLPAVFPRTVVVHDLDDEEKVCACGNELHKIGEETSEQIEFIPAHIKVIQHVRCKYGCKACEETVKTASMPNQPIPKSMASPSLLAQVIVSKFDDHLPLYRQAEIWQRSGVDLNRATLSNWMIKCGKLCQPLVQLLQEHIVQSGYVQADESPVTLLKSSKTQNRSTGYMWVYQTGFGSRKGIVYDFQESRKGVNASNFLAGFQGYLQGDAYSGYNALSMQAGVERVGCMAHARRKFVDVIKAMPHQKGYANQAVEKIKALYRIERFALEQKLDPAGVKALRAERSVPILDDLKKWLEEIYPKVPPKSPLGQAIAYSLNHWSSLTRYLADGRLLIDNNACERAIKPFTVGRKNWLFVGNINGGQSGAVLYSLIETAKANGINPYDYLVYILSELPNRAPDDLEDLLPWNCPPALQGTFKIAA